MKKRKVTFAELMKQNKKELMKDPKQMAMIEKRIEEKRVKSS